MPDPSPYDPPTPVDSQLNTATSGGAVPVVEKIGYGLGDTASNFYWKLFENFQLYFYTEIFGITATAAGLMFFVTKIWDAFNDPMIGFLADRTRTAWGRFRPYLIWMSIPFALTGMLAFYTPDLPPTQKLIYAYVTYTLVFMAYTAINIPYGALMGVLSSNSLERTSVSTYRFVLAFCGGLIVQFFTLPLVEYFGGGKVEVDKDGVVEMVVADPQTGFFWTVVCYAIGAVVLFTITFLTTKERVQPEQKKNSAIGQDLRDLLGNWPWIVLLFVGLFQILAGWTRGSATAYYFEYFAETSAIPRVMWLDLSSFGNFFFLGGIFGILGMFFTKPLVKIFGKKWLMILTMVGNAACMAAFFLLSKEQWQAMYGLHLLGAFISGPMPILLWAMYADVADYSEWLNHRRATGLIFAAATFAQKIGGALGSMVPAFGLGFSGFVEPVENIKQPQSEETIFGIISMMSTLPALFLILGCGIMLFYNLSPKLLNQIESDLSERKSSMDQS